jgi:GTP-binding protein HflX
LRSSKVQQNSFSTKREGSIPVPARDPRERAFLVGLDYRVKSEEPAAKREARKSIPAQAQAARSVAQGAVADGSRARGKRFSAEESLAELRELTLSAGAEVAGEFLQHRDKPDPATLIGRGKLEEIAGAAASSHADLLIFDHELTPSQQRNIEREVHCRVVDRTALILDIFARHARTREGQLQVELAQLRYLLPRLAGRGIEMSQLGGGIGTRGPGETQLETDRRKIYRRIRHVEQQLENVRRIRSQQRRRREAVPVATVALVGYTNAGKSTLFNALTQSKVLESSKMFATLDPTIRAVTLPSKRTVLLSDTVGFIRNLPHTLVSAFRATLEEVQRASLILNVSDVTSTSRAEQDAQVETVLKELDAQDRPQIRVLNKVDLVPLEDRGDKHNTDETIHVSAKQGIGLVPLLEAVDRQLIEDALSQIHVSVPQSEGKALAMIEAKAQICSRQYRDGAVEMQLQAPQSVARRLKSWIIKP